MVSPEGDKGWARTNFIAIVKEKFFSSRGGFSDESGVLNLEFPQNLWEDTFVPVDHKVRIDMLLTYDSIADLEKEIEMGFQEGMTVDFQQLDQLLSKLKK